MVICSLDFMKNSSKKKETGEEKIKKWRRYNKLVTLRKRQENKRLE